MIGRSYFGLLDDVVERYPFPFKIDSNRMKFELCTQLVDGKPLYLNDGYLILHPVCHQSIQDMDGLVWHLITRGFITVLHRGGDDYRLDEMPEFMANERHIESYKKLINDEIPGFMPWKLYKGRLSHIHELLSGTKSYQQWPRYKSESGFVALSKRLIKNNLTLKKTNMFGVCWSTSIVKDFINEFIETYDMNAGGPRNYWEIMTHKYSKNILITPRPKEFEKRMMALANELYHYNFGVMLSAQSDFPISVETGNSSCFDFLFMDKECIADDFVKIPKLTLPQSILTAPDIEISKIMDLHRDVGVARMEWLNIKSTYTPEDDWIEVTKAANNYSKEISALLGSKVNLGVKEDLFGYTLGKITGDLRGEAATAVGTGIGASIGGLAGAAVGAAAGYGLARVNKYYTGKITDKYKVYILNKKIVESINMKERSQNNRRIPSSYTLDKEKVDQIIKDYDPV